MDEKLQSNEKPKTNETPKTNVNPTSTEKPKPNEKLKSIGSKFSAMSPKAKRTLAVCGVAVVMGIVGYSVWKMKHPSGPGKAFVSGNGRIEATEIDVSAKLAGKLVKVMAHEGDFVKAGQPLAEMQVESLQAQLDEARARHQEAMQSMSTSVAQVAARQGDKAASVAQLAQRESDLGAAEASVSQKEAELAARLAVVTEKEAELNAAQSHFARSSTLADEGASSRQELDDDRAKVAAATAAVASAKAQSAAAEAAVRTAKGQVETARAAVDAAKAQISAAQATVEAANAQVGGAGKNVEAAKATIARIEVDYKDATLTSPRDGRVQYRISQPGEVLPAGGKVLNLVDLGDVYMTFFVPEAAAGKIAMGSEARIVLDAAPQWVIPAWISYVSSVAQFTPKTVETAAERQKLTFRVKAQIDRNLLKRQLRDIKTGLPGVAWVKIDPNAKWPPELEVRVPPESTAAPDLEPPN